MGSEMCIRDSLKCVQLGVALNTPSMLFARLLTLNAERPASQRFDTDGISTKFLSCFTFPEALASRALEEMNNPTIGIGNPDPWLRLNTVVYHFQSLWEAYFRKGLIKPSQPRANPSMSGQRVDGFELSAPAHEPVRSSSSLTMRERVLTQDPATDSDEEYMYEMKFTNGPRQGEVLCWNCLGGRHMSTQCPSKKVKRNRTDHIRRLSQDGGDVTITRTRKPPPRHRPPATGPRSRFATPPKYSVRMVDAEPESEPASSDVSQDPPENFFQDCVVEDDMSGASLGNLLSYVPVSYTHLTLPTKRIV